jgi:alpha-galactosidase
MGWNSWNRFGCDINEELIRQTADAMVSEGFLAAGYNYLNLDDCWQASRAEDGRIQEDALTFPSGLGALADYVHGKGLRFGLYTCAGTETCQRRPGSFDFEDQDAATYAAWGVDLVKVDWCFTKGLDSQQRYAIMHEAIQKSGRPMILSICNWGIDEPWLWGAQYGQLWRTTIDIMDTWASMLYNFLGTEGHGAAAGPGHWNDPDMLEVGNGGLDPAEARAHFSLWAMLAAPLIAGNDLRDLDEETRAILLNAEVIAVDQDPLGVAASRLSGEGVVGVWARPLAAAGARAVALFNGSGEARSLGFSLADLELSPEPARFRDLWLHEDLPDQGPDFQRLVQPHTVVLLKVLGSED